MATQVSLNSGAVASAGALALQTNGTTAAITLDTSQNATFAGKVTSAGALTLASNGTSTAVTIDTSQNVGIGTSSPAYKLVVAGSAPRIVSQDTTSNYITVLRGGNTIGYVGTESNIPFGIVTNGNTVATFDTSGNLGIGNTSPSSYNSAADNLVIGTSGSNGMTIVSGSTSSGYIMFADGTTGQQAYEGQITYDHTNNFMALNTSGTERVRIDSSGNLLVGTTTLVSPNSGCSLAVGSGSQIAIGHASASSGTYYAYFNYNGSVIGSITQNGTTGVLYNLTSDYRLKNNQQALTGAKDFIMALKPKKWQWWDGSGEGVGFVAHEFMEVAKYSGHGEKDAIDADGKPIYQSIQPSSSEVMANLVAFIQEQQALITQLTARITALEGA